MTKAIGMNAEIRKFINPIKQRKMKKTILTMAFLLLAMVGINAMAQQTESKCDKRTEQCESQKRDKKDWKKKKGDKRKKRQHQRLDVFNGIELTADQKAEINKLDVEKKEKMAQSREEAQKNRKKVENDYDKKLKKILSDEQYSKYLSNKERIHKQDIKQMFTKRGERPEKVARKMSKDSLMKKARHKKQATDNSK